MISDTRREELLREYFVTQVDRERRNYSTSTPDEVGNIARRRLKLAIATICHHLPDGGRILDVGCGTGLGASTLADLGFQVTAVDLIPEMIEEARREGHPEVNWLCAPFSRKLADKGSIDLVMSLGFLEYQERAGKELVKMRRFLKPGGHLLLSVPNTVSPQFSFGLSRAVFRLTREPEHVPVRHSFTPERLQRLLGMAGLILLDYQWLPEGDVEEPLAKERARDRWVHRVKNRTAPEMLTLSRSYRPEDTAVEGLSSK